MASATKVIENRDQAVSLLLGLIKSTAAGAAADFPDDQVQACNEAAARIADLMGGNTPDFPAIELQIDPHPEDEGFSKEEGKKWHTPGNRIPASAVTSKVRSDLSDHPQDEDTLRPWTDEETAEIVAMVIKDAALFWGANGAEGVKDACDGVGFTICSQLDGSGMFLPLTTVIVTAEAQEEYARNHGAYVWPGHEVVMDVNLHDHYLGESEAPLTPLKSVEDTPAP